MYFFNDEWNPSWDIDKKEKKNHNIDSLSTYYPRGENAKGYTKRKSQEDYYFFE